MSKKNKLPVASSATAPTAAIYKDDDMKYRAKDALSTLKRADEIRMDKELMRGVKACAKQELKTLKKI